MSSQNILNDIHGKENHLIKIDRLPSYVPPTKDEPPQGVVKKNRENVNVRIPKPRKRNDRKNKI